MRTPAKLGLLATLYISQGLPFGFFTQALPAVMRQQGISLAAIGLSTLLALPWGLKFLWAPWVDRRPRRRWILPLQLSSAAVLFSLALADPERSLIWLIVGVSLTNLLAATQDIATDGLALDLLTPDERGFGNGVQVAGYRVGMIIGGGALLVAFETIGWAWTFACAAGLLLLATVPVWRFRERSRAPAKVERGALRSAFRWFTADTGRVRWLVVLGVYKAGDHLGTSMLRPYFVDRGYGLADLGVLLGTAGFAAGLVGALLGGAAVHRFGRRTSLLSFGLLQALSVASYAVLSLGGGETAVYGAVIFEHVATGMATAALFTLMMDRCRPEHAGTDYTLQASLVVLATGAAGAIGGSTAQALGYAANFMLGGAVCAIAVGIAWGGTRDFAAR